MEKHYHITGEALYVPVQIGGENQRLEIFLITGEEEEKLFEFQIPTKGAAGQYQADYYAKIPLQGYCDGEFLLQGEFPIGFFEAVRQEPLEEIAGSVNGGMEEHRPSIHFTAQTGWINDPNGLVYQDGVYHLYFQYNPFDVRWENMSWGHAVSSDLLQWKQLDTVLFPDEQGTMFSGSGIVNRRKLLGLPEDTLLFFYTAAGNNNLWSEGNEFTQCLAYSLDGGRTLIKTDGAVVDTISWENRDPKVFWHEESQAYIMVLWLEKNDFGILRSSNLYKWKFSDKVTLKDAWECPDLIRVRQEDGSDFHWVFLTADGFYYWGNFDGYHFQTDGIQHQPYLTALPYAAQTYSNVEDRVIQVPWLRLPNRGQHYTGAMALPRELKVVQCRGERKLQLQPVREYWNARREIKLPSGDISYQQTGKAVELELLLAENQQKTILSINGTRVAIDREEGSLCIGETTCAVPPEARDYSFLIDDVILEVTADYGTIIGVFETASHQVDIRMESQGIEAKLYEL